MTSEQHNRIKEHEFIKEDTIKKNYRFWRLCVFLSIYVIYFISYMSRKNFSAVMLDVQEATNLKNAEIGLIISAFYIMYGLGKFINGTIADRVSIKFWLPMSLIISSGLGALMPVCASYCNTKQSVFITMILIWGLNGWFQSFAFPLCAKALTFWFCKKERGRVWSWWGTSYELGEASVGFILLPFIETFGWQLGFYLPTIVSVFVALVTFFTLQDKPQTIGLPEVEQYFGKTVEEAPEEDNTPYFKLLKKYIFCNKTMWILAFAFIFVNMLRCGSTDWVLKFFKEVGDTRTQATIKAATVPISGVLGMLTIPIVSDKLFGGRRAPANFCYLGAAGIALLCTIGILNHGPNTLTCAEKIGLFVCLAVLGAGTCGALTMMGGICSVESVSKKVAAAATGFTGMAGYIGAASCSYITGYLKDAQWVKDYNITFVEFWFWAFAAFIAAVLCLPLWNERSK